MAAASAAKPSAGGAEGAWEPGPRASRAAGAEPPAQPEASPGWARALVAEGTAETAWPGGEPSGGECRALGPRCGGLGPLSSAQFQDPRCRFSAVP